MNDMDLAVQRNSFRCSRRPSEGCRRRPSEGCC